MKTIDSLKSSLEKQADLMAEIRPHIDWQYKGFEALILDCGREMPYAPLPQHIDLGLPKSCYFNCLELLRKHNRLTYCEGYALTKDVPIPFPHAWLLDTNSHVIDPTWDNDTAVYFGIPFNTQWLSELLASRKRKDCLSVFENNYLEKYSFLKQGLPDEAITDEQK